MILAARHAQLLVIDIQERLVPAMHGVEPVVANSVKLIEASRRLQVPVTISEQYPKGIGATLAPLREAAGDAATILPKMTFSCVKDEAIAQALAARRGEGARTPIVLAGIEAHVCVLQSALDLVTAGYDVFVVADAVASRQPASRELALRRLEQAGVRLASVEMVIFEWLERAGTPDFKALMPLVK